MNQIRSHMTMFILINRLPCTVKMLQLKKTEEVLYFLTISFN